MIMNHEHNFILDPLFRPSRTCRSYLQHADGFSLIELMLAVSIMGVLAALAVPNYMEFIEKARVARSISELHGLAKDIKGFALAVGTYPNSLADVGRSTMLDPWGTPYEYYRINCSTVEDTINLARLKLRRKNSPRVIPAGYTFSSDNEWPVALSVDHGPHQASLYLAAAGGNGGGNGGGSGNGGGNGGGNGSGSNCSENGARKDRHLHPISSDFDLYSMGKDRDSVKPLTAQKSHDDVIRASDGGYYGLAKNF